MKPPRVEQFLSIPADFNQLAIVAPTPTRKKIHAVSASHGTRLHLTSDRPFQVSVDRGGLRFSRERRAREKYTGPKEQL